MGQSTTHRHTGGGDSVRNCRKIALRAAQTSFWALQYAPAVHHHRPCHDRRTVRLAVARHQRLYSGPFSVRADETSYALHSDPHHPVAILHTPSLGVELLAFGGDIGGLGAVPPAGHRSRGRAPGQGVWGEDPRS